MSMHSLYYEREADERDRTAREADLAMEAYQMAADNERAMEEDQEPEIDPLVQALVQKNKERMMIQEAFDIAESQRNVTEYNCDNPEVIELTYLAIYGLHFYPKTIGLGFVFNLDWH